MTTSGITTFTLTAFDAVKKAMQEAKILGLGREPKAAEMEDGIFAINMLLKEWQMRGLAMWCETQGTVTTVGGQSSGVLPVYMREIISAAYMNGNIARHLSKVTREDYFSLPNKVQTGAPVMYHVSRKQGAVTLYLWPVPVAAVSLSVVYERRLDTVTAVSETLDFPEEYTGALIANLAVQLGTKYGADITQELQVRAARLEMAMFDDDRPESYSMGCYD